MINKINFTKILSKRLPKIEDSELFYELRFEKKNKNFFISKKKVSKKNHTKWFISKIKDKTNKYYIYYKKKNNRSVGIVRYDKLKQYYKVSIYLKSEFANKGIGKYMLKDSEKKFKKGTLLISEIKKKNIASIKIFTQNNYDLFFKETNHNIFYKIYK